MGCVIAPTSRRANVNAAISITGFITTPNNMTTDNIPKAFFVRVIAEKIISELPLSIPPTIGIVEPTAYFKVRIPAPSNAPALKPLIVVITENNTPVNPIDHFIKLEIKSINPCNFMHLEIFDIIDSANIVDISGNKIFEI